MLPAKMRARIRVEKVTDLVPGNCWTWTGSDNGKGYGSIGPFKTPVTPSGTRLTHRIAYELLVGPIPDDRPQLDHLCRNRACCNPRHLEPVTGLENQRRGEPANRTHCKKMGHPLSGDNLILKKERGRRQCRTCYQNSIREASERRTARRRAERQTAVNEKAARIRRIRRGLPVAS